MEQEETRPTILIVEDDKSMLEIISFLLQEEGYDVLQANNGQAGLSVLEDRQPDLIISDVMMPGMDGFDFYQRVHAKIDWAQIPFIFLTARGQRTDIRRGMGLGADDYLTKPFEPEDLLSAVKVRLARAAKAREAISRARDDFSQRIIQTLTHEFRTPLALVVGYTELLETSAQDMKREDRQVVLQGLHSGTQRLIRLVEDFLLLNRLETGALALEVSQEQRTTSRPDWVVESVVEQFWEIAAQRQISLTTHLAAENVIAIISQRDLVEIVRKLVDNAIKFSKSNGGQVVVSTHCEDEFWVLEVADNGVGIRQESLPWIFAAFRQIDREKMEQQGAGVGLAIVQGLAEVYKGRLGVQSEPGKGSLFTVRLPMIVEELS
jgi:two-component system sensor histidine kinase/response regulator